MLFNCTNSTGLTAQINQENLLNQLSCDSSIRITKFNCIDIGLAKLQPWKVVANRRIEYEVINNNDTSIIWKWELGKGKCGGFKDYWKLKSTNSSGKYLYKSVANSFEAMTTTRGGNYNLFGSTFGDVIASNNIIQCASNQVKVFFEKDAIWGGGVPNWFDYWGNLMKRDIDTTGNLSNLNYIKGNKNYAEYAVRLDSNTNIWVDRFIIFYDLASTYNDETILVNDTSKGIQCYYEIFRHEYEHLNIQKSRWPNFQYNPANDVDGDLIPDDWENSALGMSLGFKVRLENPDIKDRYRDHGLDENYQEKICRDLERKIKKDKISEQYNDRDWSFDPNNKYQGKQWEKK